MKKNIKSKMLDARKIVSETPVKKSGRNTYSNYDYFTPSQVSTIVEDACQRTGILPVFTLTKTELGYIGKLTIFDTDSDDAIDFKLVTDVPQIKATNEAQKLGGMATYTERYLKMSAFGIVDNNLDFDNNKNEPVKISKKTLTKDVLASMIKYVEAGNVSTVEGQLASYSDSANKTAILKVIKNNG